MTASEIRQSFLDFFRSQEHTIVPSASLLPQSPGLLFTNAGMNQFVPFFLGTENAPYSPPRATDTQKCIRAGGKHNDLEDVGYDTYHHTFFEMLGNWSFGNYFKKEAIEWSWELITKVWGFPASRLYATVYSPSDGDPSEFDQEAYDIWKALFVKEGLDPDVHIVNGNVKDNFWMMGETGPCGPCSELHMDITPNGDTKGSLVNMDSDQCIEIWNLVFIQFNAEVDGSFRDLPAKHVDTGMGFERVCSIIQNTDGLTNFNKRISNYATDVFAPIFDKLTALSEKTYADIYPHDPGAKEQGEVLEQAIAFRVIADHLRTLSLSIADGIQPGNNGRNYVLRRILRRAVKYGRTLGFNGSTLFLSQLVDTLADQLQDVFPELSQKRQAVKEVLDREEKSFNNTLDRGLKLFSEVAVNAGGVFPGDVAYDLYSTYGFPTDLTELLCRENGFEWDQAAFEKAQAAHKATGKKGEKSSIVRAVDIKTDAVTEFVGYDSTGAEAKILELISREEATFVITDKSPFYVEKGGQVGDVGFLNDFVVESVLQVGDAIVHVLPSDAASDLNVGDNVTLSIDEVKRQAVSAHHTATHILHWALHEHVSAEATQAGSMVSEDRLRFDFNSAALNSQQLEALENAVNESIAAQDVVSWKEVKHADIKSREDIMQFFGDKYGEEVRVVQVGGESKALNGYSMELCGGTHVNSTAELGQFIIKKEEAIASGVRRIEAVCGEAAQEYIAQESERLQGEIEQAVEKLKAAEEKLIAMEVEVKPFTQTTSSGSLSELKAALKEVKDRGADLEKQGKKAAAANASKIADAMISEDVNLEENVVLSVDGDPSLLQELLNGLKKRQFQKAAFIIVNDGSKLHLGALSGADGQAAGHKAGDLIRNLSAIAGGKGGGKPDMARGAASEVDKASEVKAAAITALA